MEQVPTERWSVEDHVSLGDRLRALTWSRATIAVGTLSGVAAISALTWTYSIAAGLFLVLFGFDVWTRRQLVRGVRPTNRVLVTSALVEGAAIVAAVYLAGGNGTPVRYALIIHAVTTSLLMSREISVRSAVWVSLLLLVSHEMQELGLLQVVDQVDGSRIVPGPELGGLLVAIWITTLLTASASAINERVLQRERLDQHLHASFGEAAEAARAPGETARVLADHIRRTGPIEQVAVFDLRAEPVVLARVGGESVRGQTVAAPPDSMLDRVRRERQPIHVRRPKAAVDEQLIRLFDAPLNISAIPMIAGDDVVGAILVVHGEQARANIQRRTIEGYQRLAGHGALALANAWAAEALDRQARTDALTGVANRHTFDERFDTELERARREGQPLSLVLCDVDHFKQFNDTHGHQVGDEVLAEVAATLERERRPYDLVARYGGEEFVVVLAQTGLDAAMRAAERLRRAIEETGWSRSVTASFGVASSADGEEGRTDIIATADACLYSAKENGRNRVEGAWSRDRSRSDIDSISPPPGPHPTEKTGTTA